MPVKKPRKRKCCPLPVRERCWKKYNGDSMSGHCWVCGKPITFTGFHAGHMKPASAGGKFTVANTRPICAPCNSSMGDTPMRKFKKEYFPDAVKKVKKPKKVRVKKKQSLPPLTTGWGNMNPKVILPGLDW